MDSATRKTRLKQLLDLGSEIRRDNNIEDDDVIKRISNIIEETDGMNCIGDVQDRAHDTTEVVMDAQVVEMNHELIGEVMQKMGTTEFADEEWINAIMAIVYKNEVENWDPITEIATDICKMAKFSPSLVSAYNYKADSEGKPTKERQKREKSKRAEEVRPENLSQIDNHDKNAQNVNIYKELIRIFFDNKSEPIPYYKLIIDPHNFMNSVDNAFQVAFMARDKSIKIWSDEDGMPVVRPLHKQEKLDAPNETSQAICSLDMKLQNEMIKKYKIKKALIRRNY